MSGTNELLYLPLFFYSNAKDLWLPAIGETYKVVNKTTLQIKIRPQAKWSDGKPITADDVVYTFELTKRIGTGPGAGWDSYIASIKKVDDKTVEFVIKTPNPNYMSFVGYALGTRIVPKHVYEELEKKGANAVREFVNGDPAKQVVSGPYKLYFADENNVIYQRIENWWAKDIFGLPKPKYVAHVIYKDNPSANLAFEKGDADWASTFIPAVYELWEKKGLPIRTWFKSKPYYMPDGVGFVYISYKHKALADPVVRKAVAYAIPYEEMLDKAYFGYGSQAHPSFVIDLFESYRQWIDYGYSKYVWGTKDGRVPTDLKKANDLLDKAGYKRGPDGIRRTPDGQRLGPYTISVPYGWTDWMMMCEMIAKNLQAIGLDVKTEFPDWSVWADRMTTGNFDFIISWSTGPGFDHPWNIYRFVLDYRLTLPFGQSSWAGNWERYNNPEVMKILDEIAATLDSAKKKALYAKLQRIVQTEMPAIPAFYTAHWYEFNETKWVGWPREENPWWYPVACWSANSLPVLFGIAPKGQTPEVPKWLAPVSNGGVLIPTTDIFNALAKAKAK
ncbi:MAG: peptide ABC transporter substrate-binding protein [Dictyoglomus sp. NZ13-RE01]|nr:MAG: peptide ABC transporter substrate-binding protein [Dictyoglomus sp. NZ13-RE01]